MVSYIKAIVNGIVVSNVLILIVVEDGLVQVRVNVETGARTMS